jgi:hypothetical protein
VVAWPLTLTGEILVDGAWQPVKIRQDPIVTVSRGLTAESTEAQPTRAEITLDNTGGDYSLRNPSSPLFGRIGPYTPFRLRVGDLPPAPAPDLTDTFARTLSNGWGTSTSGDDWVIYDPAGISPPAADYSVTGGRGRILLAAVNSSRYIRNEDVSLADVDATFTLTTDQRARSDNSELGVFGSFLARLNPSSHDFYAFNVGFRTDTGLPGDAGLRLAVNIIRYVNATGTALNAQVSPKNLTYRPGVPVRVRVQCVGPHLRMRVWADGTPEPEAWHSQAYDTALPGPGQVGFRAFYSATDTTAPFLVRFGDLAVAAPVTDTGVTRISGEIASWASRRDRSGSDKTTVIEPAGLLRRLGTGQPVLRSLLRRRIPTLYPLAYWPLEEGVQGNTQVADATLNNNAGSLKVSGLKFGADDTLLGSDPLPVIDNRRARMFSTAIPGEETGSWSVSMMMRITAEDFPTDSDEHTILSFRTTGSRAAVWVLSVMRDAGAHRMRLRIYDDDNVQIGAVTTTHEDAEASTDPTAVGLLDGWRHVRVRVVQTGADLSARFEWRDETDRNWGNTTTLTGTRAGRVSMLSTIFGNGVKKMAIGHVSVWGVRFNSAYYHTGSEALGGASSMSGQPGLPTRAFLDRLAGQEDVALEIEGRGSDRLGPYPAGTVLDLVQQAANTEMGLLTDARHRLSLTYRTRDSLYNKPPGLTLSFADGQVFDPFDPTDDDKDVRNSITVSRREGSEATAEITSGRLSVQPPPDGMGPVPTSVETIVASDEQLPGQAAWRLHVATIDRMRVSQLTLEMANPRMQPLVDQVLRLDVGSRIQITDVPAYYTPDGFDLLVLGYRETFAEGHWRVTFNCLPYEPYLVAQVGGSALGRADANEGGSLLALAATATSGQLLVHTPARGPKGPATWIESAGPGPTYPAEFPLDIRLGGETARLTACVPAAWDTFTRSVTGGWGTSTSGFAWAESGGAASDRSVNGSAGVITLASAPDSLRFQRLIGNIADCEILVRVSVDQIATGSSMAPGLLLRFTSAVDFYRARVHFNPGGTMSAAITRGITTLGATAALPYTYTAGAWFWMRARLTGHRVQLRVWPDGQREPAAWHKDETVTNPIASGQVGVTASAFAGLTNVNPQLRFDDFQVVTPQLMTVQRSLNGVTKAHDVGTEVRLAQPAVVAL